MPGRSRRRPTAILRRTHRLPADAETAKDGEAMRTPTQVEAVLGMLAAADPEVPPENWRCYREILREGFESIDRRLQEYGPLEPECFSLEEANNRLARREDLMRWRRI